MKIRLATVEITDKDRRAIADHYGQTGMASRETCKAYLESAMYGELEVMAGDFEFREQPIDQPAGASRASES
jgi:hypothetical protein